MSSFVENINKVAGITGLQNVSDNLEDIQNVNANMVDVLNASTFVNGLTNIIYGAGVPGSSINPFNGTNAIYVDTNTNTSYICKDATLNANVWVVNGSGQFADIGTSIGKGVQFMAQVSGVEDIVVPEGTNAFSIESFVLESGASLIVPNGSVYKVL